MFAFVCVCTRVCPHTYGTAPGCDVTNSKLCVICTRCFKIRLTAMRDPGTSEATHREEDGRAGDDVQTLVGWRLEVEEFAFVDGR